MGQWPGLKGPGPFKTHQGLSPAASFTPMEPSGKSKFPWRSGLFSPVCSHSPRKERGPERGRDGEEAGGGEGEKEAAFVFTPQPTLGWRWVAGLRFSSLCEQRSAVEI